jgi:hypothetical protein
MVRSMGVKALAQEAMTLAIEAVRAFGGRSLAG